MSDPNDEQIQILGWHRFPGITVGELRLREQHGDELSKLIDKLKTELDELGPNPERKFVAKVMAKLKKLEAKHTKEIAEYRATLPRDKLPRHKL